MSPIKYAIEKRYKSDGDSVDYIEPFEDIPK